MGRSLISFKEKDTRYFIVWSSVVDAPITCALTLSELRCYPNAYAGAFDDRWTLSDLKTTIKYGSSFGESIEEHIKFNAAGRRGGQVKAKTIFKQALKDRKEYLLEHKWEDRTGKCDFFCSVCDKDYFQSRIMEKCLIRLKQTPPDYGDQEDE